MSIIHPFCLNLDDVRQIFTEQTSWRLPEDANEKAKDSAVILNESDINDLLKKKTFINFVSLLNASCFFLTKQERGAAISSSILTIAKLVAPEISNNSPDSLDLTAPCSDSEFSNSLVEALAEKLKLTDPEKKMFEQPFVTASTVLALAAVGERIVDYAAIAQCYSIEASTAASNIASDQFTRENSPLYVSLAAQRLTDITTNSKLLKKKGGNDSLNELPEVYAPIYAAVAAVRTSVAKPLHFYSRISLDTACRNLVDGIRTVINSLSAEQTQEISPQNALHVCFDESIKKYEATKAQVAEASAKGRKYYFGLVTTSFINALAKDGPNHLIQLPVFKLQQMKKAICKEAVGTRDLLPKSMSIREYVTKIVTGIFKKHGAVTIDTPVFELREVLTEKYGEESKLIYNLEDQGGELLSLRYDLTVPFARFVATHGITSIKRYHIAKVYRRDKPAIERGRFREFYQCDFDIAGPSGPMIADSEVISIIYELLTEIGKIGKFDFVINVSHRQLLSAMTTVAGVPAEKFKTICSSVDKLDKQPWNEVRNELVNVKGLSEQSADKLWEYLQLNGNPFEVIEKLRQKEEFLKVAEKTLNEMELLFNYLKCLNVLDKIDFNLSLARGLDYYTGVILEAIAIDGKNEVKVGSIAGGGRYDELIGMFSGKKIPAVGASLGIERIYALAEKNLSDITREVETQVMVCSVAQNYTKERLQLASELWKAGIPTEFSYKEKPDVKVQIGQASNAQAKIALFLGPEEVENGKVKVKILLDKSEVKGDEKASGNEYLVERSQVVEEVQKLLK